MSDSPFDIPKIKRDPVGCQPNESTAPRAKPDYSAAILSSPVLSELDAPKRTPLLGCWMKEADLGFIFAARGVGKTWMTMLIGNALVNAVSLGEWQAGVSQRRVLYVDGEMALADSRERTRTIGITSPNFQWLHHEWLFEKTEQILNIANSDCREAVSELLRDGDVLILDNLSALCRGVAENDNDSWEILLPWLLSFRRRKVTVIIVHHAGRNGEMRGASRREDAANWILRLQDDTQGDDECQKAIISSFPKARGCRPQEAAPMRWVIKTEGGSLAITCKPHTGPDALCVHILEGVESATECADLLGVGKGTVSKWAKRLAGAGRIRIESGKYLPPNSGTDRSSRK